MSELPHTEQRDSPPITTVDVGNEELFTVREAMRDLNRIVAKLQSGELEKAVLMKGCQMVALIEPIEGCRS